MNNVLRRGLALLLALVVCLGFIPALQVDASAASSSTVSYTYDGTKIYNWGARGTVATFLSPNAEKFYTGSYTYAALSAYSGGTGKSDAPDSALYNQLQSLMKSKQTYTTSYDATKSLFKYTDCQNGGGAISSFYSGKSIGPSWDGSWNREHTWPNSKGSGSSENDIMMLRPTSTSENSSRGNTAYGKSSGYYNPNSESGGKYDLRGDVARIFLYVYVRWGKGISSDNINHAWGSSGVMESVDVLLEWIEADPVDTWELGRNDSVESITGTRNVFVDYPEFAFLLFGKEIPASMTTPSGGSNTGCNHNNFDAGVVVAATCTAKGYTVFTCKTSGCGYSYQTNSTPAKGHSYTNGTCVSCGADEPIAPSNPTYATEIVTGQAYKLGFFSTNKNAEYYFTGAMDTNNSYYGATSTDYTEGVDVYAEATSGGYRLYFINNNQKQYINLVISGTHRNFTFSSTATSVFTWDSAKHSFYTTLDGEKCYMGTYGTYVTMAVLQESKYKDTDYIARLYTTDSQSGSGSGSEVQPCQHNYAATVTAPSCTAEGFTTYKCTLCNDSYTGNKVAATGHSYSNGSCIDCGAAKPSTPPTTAATLSISFASTTNRTEFNASKQVWATDGLTLTNNKAASTSNVADYSNPARFYAASSITVECAGMTSIVFECSGSSYVTPLKNSITGATVSVDGNKVTVTFSSPTNSFTIEKLTAQVRMTGITANVAGQGQTQCQHTSTSLVGAVQATCTKEGYTGNTRCTSCGDIITTGSVIPATGHDEVEHDAKDATCTENGWAAYVTCENCDYSTYVVILAFGHKDDNDDGLCDTCGQQEELPCEHVNISIVGAVQATCTTAGHSGKTVCDDCGETLSDGQAIPSTGHTEVTDAAVAPTCTTTGLTEGKHCSVCNAVLVAQETVATSEHDFGEWTETTAPTCTSKGTEQRDCNNCDHHETRQTLPLGHSDADNDGKCDNCNKQLDGTNTPNTGNSGSTSNTFMDIIMSIIEAITNAINSLIESIFGGKQ